MRAAGERRVSGRSSAMIGISLAMIGIPLAMIGIPLATNRIMETNPAPEPANAPLPKKTGSRKSFPSATGFLIKSFSEAVGTHRTVLL